MNKNKFLLNYLLLSSLLGNWLLEMAEEHPDANFVGIDISPIYPNEYDSNKPTNVAFLNFDALSENGLPFPNDTFDFVYQRFMGLSITENQWTKHIEGINYYYFFLF